MLYKIYEFNNHKNLNYIFFNKKFFKFKSIYYISKIFARILFINNYYSNYYKII